MGESQKRLGLVLLAGTCFSFFPPPHVFDVGKFMIVPNAFWNCHLQEVRGVDVLHFRNVDVGLENNFHIERESTALAAFEGTPCAQFHAVSPLILKPRSVQHECYLEETDTK